MRCRDSFWSLGPGRLLSLLVLHLAACGDDPAPGENGGTIHEPRGTSLLVQVLDTSNTPIPSALVTALGDTTRPTDGAGYILYENLTPGRFSARVERWGYASASAVVELPEGAHGGTVARLIPLPSRIPFDASAGAALDQGPVHVTIPSNAIVDANGEPFTGMAEATIVPLDPTTDLVHVPGPLQGIVQADGSVVGLESFFMAEVTLWNGAQRLQLAPGKKATLEFVLPDSIAMNVQEGLSIPAWWFDLDAGIWREEGAGTVQASVAEPGKTAWAAHVGHFTWWNADARWDDKHCVRVHLLDADGNAVPNVSLGAVAVDYAGNTSPKISDSDGYACLDFKKGGTVLVTAGNPAMPIVSDPVTGAGPAAACNQPGTACIDLPLVAPTNSVCASGAWEACPYGGTPVGICMAGSHWCNATGTAWSDCVGEVLPQVEDCTMAGDEDCDGLENEEGMNCACVPGEVAQCYTGPTGTNGVGACKPGQRTCQNGFFGSCVGQVVPSQETCATVNVDDDCDGSSECLGAGLWSKAYGNSAYQGAYATAIDGANNIVIAGGIQGTVDFESGPLTSADSSTDVFVAKLGTNGTTLWARRFGGVEKDDAQAAAVDGAGNVVIVGDAQSTLDFGGGPLPSAGSSDIFIAKLDTSGNHLWSRRLGDAAEQRASAVAVDGAGNVVMTGYFLGTVDPGGGPHTSAGTRAILVAKFGTSGAPLWSRSFEDPNTGQFTTAVAVDAQGNVFVTGSLKGAVDFGGGVLTSAGDADVFVMKLDPNGGHVWSRRFGDAVFQEAKGVAIDNTGNVVITGWFDGSLDFGGAPLTSVGGYDGFVAKLDTNGNHVFSRRFGGPGNQVPRAAATDGTGNVVITGGFDGSVDLGGGPLTSAGGDDVFVAKLDSSGNHVWSRRYGDADGQNGYDTAIDNAGNVVITGAFSGAMLVGGVALTSAGSSDIFLAKLTP
ncbi:hypothetical protein [Polyangium sp. y55x31]|uniref:hypothetical protein n=1 Tax=Polyangium sp. y55x31 TaxID=3042688 RepID=UPI0024829AB0|nr:hypothetical protein [Polyangium sp. y55x31]MDI1476534.1 hypothetical protein [Polyangium sp. y55x31]